jgi:hypothetical protein
MQRAAGASDGERGISKNAEALLWRGLDFRGR